MSDKCDDNRFLASEEKPRSFYSYIRNAAILLKLHGLFPFENIHSDDGRSLSFKWLSLNVLWGFALYAISSIVLYWLPSDRETKNIFLFQYTIRAWIFYICYSINNRQFLNLLFQLEEINNKFFNVSRTLNRNFSDTWRYCIAFEICAFTLYCFMQAMFVLSVMKPELSTIFTLTVLLASVTSLVEIYVSILYLLIASKINSFYTILYDSYPSLSQLNHQNDFIMQRIGEFLRILHTDLSDCCDSLHQWFGITFICIFSTLVGRTLLIFYKITILAGRISIINDVTSLVQIFGYIYILTSTSQKLVDSNMKICSIVRNTSTIVLSSRLQFQHRMMILQTTALPINTCALGFFTTTRSLIPAILSVIAIYITVIIQIGTPDDIFTEFIKGSTSTNAT